MVSVVWAPSERPAERHLLVLAHNNGIPAIDKGYFHVSDQKDWGGSGPFDMRLEEVIERAKAWATDLGISQVVVVRKS